MKIHPVANLFPMMSSDELIELSKDIQTHGQHMPVITADIDGEQVLIDGRNRMAACDLIGVEPWTEDYTQEIGGRIVDYILGLNIKRRNLTASQKAAIAVQALPFQREEAKKRQAAKNSVPPNVAEVKGEAIEIAAKSVGAGKEYVRQAEIIQSEDPEAFEEVKAGKKTIRKAMQEIKAKKHTLFPPDDDRPCEEDNDEEATPMQGDTPGLERLKSVWTDATIAEQGHFIIWLKKGGVI